MSLGFSIKMIVQELLKPENSDLVFIITYFGEGDIDQSFMYGFSIVYSDDPLSFDEFSNWTKQIEVQFKDTKLDMGETINMSQAYDNYLQCFEDRLAQTPISQSQAERFNEIVMKYDDGWSGAIYGTVCRGVQTLIRQHFLSNN